MNNLPQFDWHSAITGTVYFALYIGFFALIARLIVEYGMGQALSAKGYEQLYAEIQDEINLLARTSENFDRIQSKIQALKALKYKDRERTEVLTRQFYIAFGKEWLKRVLEKSRDHKTFLSDEKPDFGLAG